MGFDIGGELGKLISININNKFTKEVDTVKSVIMDSYDEKLLDVVTDRSSKTNPNLYRDDFSERVDKFEYIERDGKSLSFVTPDMENFDFSGRLKVIETILNGVAGLYVEINEEDYVAVFDKKPINEESFYEYVAPKDRIYLIKYSSIIRRAESKLRKRLVRYPFSNSPPIDVFGAGSSYIDKNIGSWVKTAIEMSKNEYVTRNKGATL